MAFTTRVFRSEMYGIQDGASENAYIPVWYNQKIPALTTTWHDSQVIGQPVSGVPMPLVLRDRPFPSLFHTRQ